MCRGLFIIGTGTDVGKTFVTALILKKLKDMGLRAGYYKAALSGAEDIAHSDAGYVKKISGIDQEDSSMVSYLYQNAVSPHLAAKLEENPVELETIKRDFEKVCNRYDYVTVEGSGGIVCPIRWDGQEHILLEDIIKQLGLNTLLVADAGLGTINAAVTTVEYLVRHGISVSGIILNHYTGDRMQQDNLYMIEQLTNIKVVATVEPEAAELKIDEKDLIKIYKKLFFMRNEQ